MAKLDQTIAVKVSPEDMRRLRANVVRLAIKRFLATTWMKEQ